MRTTRRKKSYFLRRQNPSMSAQGSYEPGTCSWVPKDRLYDFEEKHYSYYPHPQAGAKCFRVASLGGNATREKYLMVKPDAKKLAT
jgi:hypothetical protein